MAHEHIERLKSRLAARDQALTDVVAKARSEGVSDEDLVKALSSLPKSVILDMLYPGVSEVQKRLAHEMLKDASGAKRGVQVGAATAYPQSGRRTYASFREVIPLTDSTLLKDELAAREAALEKARAPRKADDERRRKNMEQGRANIEHRGID